MIKNWEITRVVSSRYYLKLFAATFIVTVGMVGLTNVVIDPFGVYRLILIDGFNKYKEPGLRRFEAQIEYQMKSKKPQAIILGSSRTINISADHRGWRARPVANLSMSGAVIREIVSLLKYTNSKRPLEQVVVGLDFFAFNANEKSRGDRGVKEAILRTSGEEYSVKGRGWVSQINVPGLTNYPFAIGTLEHSLKTIWNQDKYERFYDDANGRYDRFVLELANGQNTKFNKPYTINYSSGGSTFDHFRELVDFCYQNEIDLRLYISPIHALWYEKYVRSGKLDKIENWKRKIVKILDDTSKRHQKKIPLSVLDFSGYSQITTEDLPVWGGQIEAMRWYSDLNHFSDTQGDRILDRLFLPPRRNDGLHGSYGVRLSPQNIEQHLRRIRNEREAYLARRGSHIEQLFSKATRRASSLH